ncbi:isoprenoid synthase domain-containing protein [Dichotomocladium elegans]|nr:isoprenoid synthase domain-containing protein [Dichotomocladium elegans]
MPFTGQANTWENALCEAQGLAVDGNKNASTNGKFLDPAKLLGPDLWELRGNITKLLGSGHPFLNTLTTHFIGEEGAGQQIRPLIVLLMAKATNNNTIIDSQQRLAEITQMIHVASLLHDDILDDQTSVFGNKMAILAGDFLLARASLALAYLRKPECVELIATCIANLVEGEVMQLVKREEHISGKGLVDYYLDQIDMKTASLFGQSCKGAAVLSDTGFQQHAYAFGRHFGVAHQLIEDVIEFNDTVRPTAPALFASESIPDLIPLIQRQFIQDGDQEKARLMVYRGDGLKKTLALAESHCNKAVEAVDSLPPSDARSALVQLAQNLLKRSK